MIPFIDNKTMEMIDEVNKRSFTEFKRKYPYANLLRFVPNAQHKGYKVTPEIDFKAPDGSTYRITGDKLKKNYV